MKRFVLNPEPFSSKDILNKLEENDIFINDYAKQYFAHPLFSTEKAETTVITIASLREIGFDSGATLNELLQTIPQIGLKPCPVNTGVFLRLFWKDQPQSHDSLLSGTHRSPDGAVTVLSEILEQDDTFPKGLYLRHVEGKLWLRGYVCDASYRFSGEDLFAFDAAFTKGEGHNCLCYDAMEKKEF
ncbi:MAG: hypothetical protein IKR11_10375 [Solobacterium sp.]|nr:hypothetical protein [Solobacterium sp.]